MVGDDVRVVELIGRVVARPAGELRCPRDHVVDVLRRHFRPALHGGNDIELGTQRSHQLEALLGEAIGHHDQRAVALRSTDERKRGPGAPAGVLDDSVAGRDQTVALRTLDHRERHAVLHRPGRILVLELQPKLGPIRGPAPVQANQRRVANRPEDRIH